MPLSRCICLLKKNIRTSPKKYKIFLRKHELNMNFYIFDGKKFIFNLCFVNFGNGFYNIILISYLCTISLKIQKLNLK